MRKIDRAFLKRNLGGEYPNGPRASVTLLNEAERRVYLLGWNSHYRDFVHPLSTAGFYPASTPGRDRSHAEWHEAIERVRRGELEAGLILQVPADPTAPVLVAERILDGVFFGEILDEDGELAFRVDDRRPLATARAPRQQTA